MRSLQDLTVGPETDKSPNIDSKPPKQADNMLDCLIYCICGIYRGGDSTIIYLGITANFRMFPVQVVCSIQSRKLIVMMPGLNFFIQLERRKYVIVFCFFSFYFWTYLIRGFIATLNQKGDFWIYAWTFKKSPLNVLFQMLGCG